MKNFNYSLILCCIFLCFSCSKDHETSEIINQDPITKEEVLKICYSDKFAKTSEIKGVEFEDALRKFLTPSELEQVLIDYIKRNETTNSKKSALLVQFFQEFRDLYQLSFFESEDANKKEQFTTYFVNNVIKRKDTDFLNRLTCTFDDLNCTDMADGTCMLQEDHIFYTQQKPCSSSIVATDCARSGEDVEHDDCDYSYHWAISQAVFNNNSTNAYNWFWYCDNSGYRALMPSGISGYKIGIPNAGTMDYYASTFLGNRHIFALYFAYVGSCEQDQWISDTKFKWTHQMNTPKK